MKISPRLVHIVRNLFAQCFDGRKLDLISDPIEKADLHFALRRQFNGMKIEKVSFNGKRIRAKGRTITNVGYGLEALAPDLRPGDVDAIFRHKFFVTRQVDCGHSVLRTIASTAARRGENAKRTRQQMAGATHATFENQFSNVTARNRLAAQLLLRIGFSLQHPSLAQAGAEIT